MRRTQIYLDEEMDGQLRALAAAEGRSAAALIREALVAYLATRRPDRIRDPILDMAGAYEGGPTDAAEEHDHYLYGAHRRRQ